MPRMKEEKRNELEAFWHAHIQGWRDSTLNQREYCEAHRLPLKRFGNWRAEFRHENPPKIGKLFYRRGGASEHMLKHMPKEILPVPATYIQSGRSGDSVRRRNFSRADKKCIVDEACRDGASVSGVAKKYGIPGPERPFVSTAANEFQSPQVPMLSAEVGAQTWHFFPFTESLTVCGETARA